MSVKFASVKVVIKESYYYYYFGTICQLKSVGLICRWTRSAKN